MYIFAGLPLFIHLFSLFFSLNVSVGAWLALVKLCLIKHSWRRCGVLLDTAWLQLVWKCCLIRTRSRYCRSSAQRGLVNIHVKALPDEAWFALVRSSALYALWDDIPGGMKCPVE